MRKKGSILVQNFKVNTNKQTCLYNMKKIVFIALVFIASVSQIFGSQLITYADIKHEKKYYLFYTNKKLKEVSFRFVLAKGVTDKQVKEFLKKQSYIKRVSIGRSNGDTITSTLYFKTHPNASEVRKTMEELGLVSLKINGQRIYVKNLITVEEAFAENAKYSPNNMVYKPEYSDPNMPEYYEYELYRLKTKMKYMQTSEYPRYLYEGYVTKFQDNIDGVLKDKEQYYETH